MANLICDRHEFLLVLSQHRGQWQLQTLRWVRGVGLVAHDVLSFDTFEDAMSRLEKTANFAVTNGFKVKKNIHAVDASTWRN